MIIAKGQVVSRKNKSYVITSCDEHEVKLQAVGQDGRPGRGRPAVVARTQYPQWLDPKTVSSFGGQHFVIGDSKYHLISYNAVEERFTLRGVDATGDYKRGRPKMMYLEDFSDEQQSTLRSLVNM